MDIIRNECYIVANTFGVSRQTVYSRIKNFEENRLQEFLQDGRVA